MAVKIYYKTALAGETGALDEIDGSLLADGYLALVIISTALYVFRLSASSGAAESLPNVITPNANAGTKRWLRLQTLTEVSSTLGTATGISVTDSGGYFDGTNVETVLAELGVDMAALTTDVGGYTAAIALNTSHRTNTSNPHTVTKTQVGLSNVTNDAQLKASALATTITDTDAVVPSSGAVVDYAIPKTYLETVITNSDVKIPSSGAVIDYLATLTPAEEIKVVIIGDSLSQEGAFLGSWINVFSNLCKQSGLNVNVVSYAVGGHTFYKAMTEDAHENGTKTQVEMAIAYGADIVIVALGINDCIYANTRTQAQIIQDGVDVRTLLLAGLPSAKIALMLETPHNYASVGLIPSALTNINAVPASHATITYQGQAGCRVNNSTWEGTSVGATNLAKHKVWGEMATALSAHYGDYFHVNMWKIARMGCHVDLLHVDFEGHYWMALYVMDWFRNNNDIDNNILDLTNDWWSLDLFYPIAAGSTREAYTYGNYRGVNVKTRMTHWMYAQRGLEISLSPSENITGYTTQIITISGADPGASVWYGYDSGNITDTSRDINAEGFHKAVYTPAELAVDISAGAHKVVTAIKLTTDNTFDVFEKAITLSAGSAPAYLPSSYLETTITNSTTKIPSSSAVVAYVTTPPTMTALSVTGNITVGGYVDGVDVLGLANSYGNSVNQTVNTTSSPTFAGLTVPGITRSGDIVFNNGTTTLHHTTSYLRPSAANAMDIGTSTIYFNYILGNHLLYKTDHGVFDTLDDLQIIHNVANVEGFNADLLAMPAEFTNYKELREEVRIENGDLISDEDFDEMLKDPNELGHRLFKNLGKSHLLLEGSIRQLDRETSGLVQELSEWIYNIDQRLKKIETQKLKKIENQIKKLTKMIKDSI